MKKNIKHSKGKQLSLLNRYYKITQFYSFLRSTLYRGAIVIALVVLLFLLVDYFVFDIKGFLSSLLDTYPPEIILSSFLVSETILGLVPPELYIIWASKTSSPWLLVFVLASLSYLGGILAYFLGVRIFYISSVKNYIESKIEKHIVMLRKWGGIFVLIGALLPLPYAVVSFACGLIKYSFKSYLLWGLFRYVRFMIYALVIFQVFDGA